MTVIYMHAEGVIQDLVPAVSLFREEADVLGVKFVFEDPSKISEPGGCDAAVTVPQAKDESEARAIVQAMIDQVPGGNDVFTVLLGGPLR